jgi:hypothetical protein
MKFIFLTTIRSGTFQCRVKPLINSNFFDGIDDYLVEFPEIPFLPKVVNTADFVISNYLAEWQLVVYIYFIFHNVVYVL